MLKKYLKQLNDSPTSFNAVSTVIDELEKKGYKSFVTNSQFTWNQKVYLTKNDSSIIALHIPSKKEVHSFQIVASHLDCPGFKLKPDALIIEDGYVKLNVESYGGVILSTWLDRPLSLAGRVMLKVGNKIQTKIIQIKKDIALIPNVAIHMNREVNNGYKFNVKNDMKPFLSTDTTMKLEDVLKKEVQLEGEVLSYDLFLYPTSEAKQWGLNDEFISSYHIDNLGCAFSSLEAFCQTDDVKSIAIYASFDNEEIGSLTQQGADSNFFYDVLTKVCKDLDLDYLSMLEQSFLVSADNAHAHHPNHPEFSDCKNKTFLNKGVVIKYNANQSYTSDSYSIAIFKELARRSETPLQYYTNRADLRGGGTLGNLSNAHVSLASIDIGLPQLAMHSCCETSGTEDYLSMVQVLKEFYRSRIDKNKDEIEIV